MQGVGHDFRGDEPVVIAIRRGLETNDSALAGDGAGWRVEQVVRQTKDDVDQAADIDRFRPAQQDARATHVHGRCAMPSASRLATILGTQAQRKTCGPRRVSRQGLLMFHDVVATGAVRTGTCNRRVELSVPEPARPGKGPNVTDAPPDQGVSTRR